MKFHISPKLRIICLAFFVSCAGSEQQSDNATQAANKTMEFYGNAQGTTFSVICNDSLDVTTREIEAIFEDFDRALSIWIDSSTISMINRSSAGSIRYTDKRNYFNRCYKEALEVYNITYGAFDPTIQPLWSVWGFDGDGNIPDTAVVDSLRAYIGFSQGNHFNFSPVVDSNKFCEIQKITPNAKLGFDGIAQGLTVDVISEFLEGKGAANYYVEVGGEIRVRGLNSDGEMWRIGIDKPIDGSDATDREVQTVVQLKDRSIATSGSYRKFFVRDGVKYSHTIDPKTGRPVKHSLLSVSVISNSCAMSDGLATAFMVMGADSAMQFVNSHPELDLDVYLIFENAKGRMETFYTEDFRDAIVE